MPDRRVCIITGASRGVGRATALRLAAAGWDVAAAARGQADLESLGSEVRARGARCETVAADVGRPDQAQRVIETAVSRLGRLDLLVNNAGAAPLASIEQTTPQLFDETIAINVAAVFHMTRCAWPVLRGRGGGTIVNISSIAAADPFPGFSVYGACKAWVNLFTKAAAGEGKELGIRVFCVAPGAIETQMLRQHFKDFPAEQTLTPDDVAAVIERLVDPAWRHATGETIYVRR